MNRLGASEANPKGAYQGRYAQNAALDLSSM